MIEMYKNKETLRSNSSVHDHVGFQIETKTHQKSQNLPFTIKEFTLSEILRKWENYVFQHPGSNFFSHPLWLKALESEFNRKAIIFACQDSQGNLKGILPLMSTLGLPLKKKELITGRRFSSLPRTPLGGFLFDNKKIQHLLINAAIKKTSEFNNLYLQLKSYSSDLNDDLPELNKINWRESFYLTLPDSPNKIRFGNKKHHHKVKWGINKAISLGVKVREAETEKDLKEWYRLYLETQRWHMVAARPYRFFKFLYENFVSNGLMKILLAESNIANGKAIVAGSIFFSFNDTVFYSFNGRNKNGLTFHANDLIQWKAINYACENGYTYYDMGEVSNCNSSLSQFKSKWGCESKQIYHYYYSNNDYYNLGKSDISEENKVLKSVWRKLPLKVTQEWGVLTNRFL
ncbi:MAG: GNAT family N-acetyltransferase [Ignavibacteriaceae bacterium]